MTNLDFLNHKNNFNQPEIASVVDELSFWSARFGQLLFDNLEIKANLDILDLGCANGFPLFELAHTHGRSARLVGLDLWAEALQRARSKLLTYQLPNVSLVRADAACLPFQNESFDLIVSNLGVNNFADLAATMGELFRVAKADARLVLTTNIKGHMAEFYQIYREILRELNNREYLVRLAINEDHRGSRESFTTALQTAGFKVDSAVESQFSLHYLDGEAFFNHSLTKIGFLDGWRAVIDAVDEEAVFTKLLSGLNQLARQHHGLTMTVPMLYLEASKQ